MCELTIFLDIQFVSSTVIHIVIQVSLEIFDDSFVLLLFFHQRLYTILSLMLFDFTNFVCLYKIIQNRHCYYVSNTSSIISENSSSLCPHLNKQTQVFYPFILRIKRNYMATQYEIASIGVDMNAPSRIVMIFHEVQASIFI